MVVDEVMLRAYVDGELDAGQRAQVEAALARSETLQASVAALRASCLPYRAAFDAQDLPPLPQDLSARVAELSAIAAASSATSGAMSGATLGADTGMARRAWLRRRAAAVGAGLAASFMAGWLMPRRLLTGFGAEAGVTDAAPGAEQASGLPDWALAVARYHALYVRQTVDRAGAALPLDDLLAGMVVLPGVRLRVPDLSGRGLSYRRAQRLGHQGEPLIQLVYLPERGRPVAVCFLPVAGRSEPVLTVVGTQTVASWIEAGLGFVVVGDLPMTDMAELVREVRSQVLA